MRALIARFPGDPTGYRIILPDDAGVSDAYELVTRPVGIGRARVPEESCWVKAVCGGEYLLVDLCKAYLIAEDKNASPVGARPDPPLDAGNRSS